MADDIGLDVSMKETAVSNRREGKRVWRGGAPPIQGLLPNLAASGHLPQKRVVFETGPLAVWFYHALCSWGVPAICIDARHAKEALDMAANKTDANDADGFAHLAEVGFFREVRVKGFDRMQTRTLVAARNTLVRITQLSNQIRGIMKTFGLIVAAGKGSTFEENVRSRLSTRKDLLPSCCRCWNPGAA
ncbi:IS110 family transposase [Pelagibacterium luteolum]|uniref:Transposase n=1 Tax=Pelagibacterium luteolum TaxID=440168 RepID=A0A1G7Y217_9HYPH|nr:Transposase [Pelagibacterium luteolum]